MESVEELKRKIRLNVEKNAKSSIFRPTDHILEFLTNNKLSCNEKIQNESLFNEGKKQTFNLLLFGGAALIGIFYSILNKGMAGPMIFIMGLAALISTVIKYFDKGEELRIDSNGILIKKEELLSWSIIDYMYFRTDWDGEGNYPETQLVIMTSSGNKKKIDVDNLNKPKHQIGRLLYCAMKQFK